MRRILAEKAPLRAREVATRDEARALFESMGEELKLSRLDDIPAGEPITLFRHGALRRPLPRARTCSTPSRSAR